MLLPTETFDLNRPKLIYFATWRPAIPPIDHRPWLKTSLPNTASPLALE
jgi:hypothetical protein